MSANVLIPIFCIGIRGYECQCSDPLAEYGAQCDSVAQSCGNFTAPDNSGTVKSFDSYSGSLIVVECDEGYYSSGEIVK